MSAQRSISAVLVLFALWVGGCTPRESAKLPSLTYTAMIEEIRAGKAISVEINGNTAVVNFKETPTEAKQKGSKKTVFKVETPNSAVQRSRLVSLCAQQSVRVIQYK